VHRLQEVFLDHVQARSDEETGVGWAYLATLRVREIIMPSPQRTSEPRLRRRTAPHVTRSARPAAPETRVQRRSVRERRSAGEPISELDAMESYFEDLKSHALLSADEERALAQEIHDRAIDHWQALLSHPPALAMVAAALEVPAYRRKVLALRAAERRAATRGRVRKVAEQLREHHESHRALAEVETKVRGAFDAQPGTKTYLARVSEARSAHERAKNRLVAANLRLVLAMARRYNQNLMPLADLIQEGNLGLMRAVEGYDHRRGFRFSTYASWWIRHALNRGLSDRGRLVRLPVHAMEGQQRVARLTNAAIARTGEAPSLAELSAQTGLDEKKLALLRTHATAAGTVSLDRPVGDDGDATLLDRLPGSAEEQPDEQLAAQDWEADLAALLPTLPPLEAAILRFRFGLDDGHELTLAEIGTKYNLSRERIRQLQEQALGRLRLALARRRGAWEGALDLGA
jgi:RNA polymerase primary sigma factor